MMNEKAKVPTGISFFVKYLTVRVVLCMVVGTLVEVPVMLTLVKITNQTSHWFPPEKELKA